MCIDDALQWMAGPLSFNMIVNQPHDLLSVLIEKGAAEG